MQKLITEKHVMIGSQAKNKETVLQEIAEMAVELGITNNEDKIYEALLEREEEVSTGFTDGFAIPHTLDSSVEKVGLIVSKLENGVEWQSLDGEKTDFVIAILVPAKMTGNIHLQILSKLSRSLMKAEFRNKLKSSENSKEIFEYINSIIKE